MSTTIDARELEAGRTIEVDGIKTHLHEAGEGPNLLLLHGSGPGVSAWANWRLVIADLAERFHVIAPDQVGFGGTDARPDGRYGREVWTNHAAALLDTLGIEQTHIIGNSMGGAIALSLAAARPKTLDKMVLMGPAGVDMPLPEGLDRVWGYTPDREAMKGLIQLFAYDQSIVTDDLIDMRFEQSKDPRNRERYEAMFPPPRQRWVDDLALDDSELKAIQQETLLVHGFDDQVVPRDSSLKLMERLPNANAFLIGHCGHWVQIEQTKTFKRVVVEFLTADA
jgi:2-hydroxymuconate-semialdehyde hydrolase